MRLFLIFISAAFAAVDSLSYSDTVPVCGDYIVSWTGGQPPFQLLIAPIAGTAALYDTNDTQFNWKPDLRDGTEFVMTVADSTGYNLAPVSALLTTKNGNITDLSCVPARQNVVDFTFYFPNDATLSTYAQCEAELVRWDAAISPYTVLSLPVVASGGFVLAQNYSNTTNGTMTASVPYGFQFIVAMLDAGTYRNGGVSDYATVAQMSQNSTCLVGDPIAVTSQTSLGVMSRTVSTQTRTVSITAQTSSTVLTSPTASATKSGLSLGAKLGIGLGAGIGGLLVLLLLLCLLLRRKPKHKEELNLDGPNDPVDPYPLASTYQSTNQSPSMDQSVPNEKGSQTYESTSYIHLQDAGSIHPSLHDQIPVQVELPPMYSQIQHRHPLKDEILGLRDD